MAPAQARTHGLGRWPTCWPPLGPGEAPAPTAAGANDRSWRRRRWGSEPHPALRATFRSLPFKVGISTTFPGGLPCASSPHGAGTQVKAALLGTWTSPALLREAPRKFKALAALPPSPFPSEPQHLPSHPRPTLTPNSLVPRPCRQFLCSVSSAMSLHSHPLSFLLKGTPCHRCLGCESSHSEALRTRIRPLQTQARLHYSSPRRDQSPVLSPGCMGTVLAELKSNAHPENGFKWSRRPVVYVAPPF